MGRGCDHGQPGRALRRAAMLLLVAVASVHAQEVPAAEARRLAVEKQIQAILAPHGDDRAQWAQKYLDRLVRLQRQMKDAGDLAGLLAVKTEMRRFDESPVLRSENLSGDSKKLRQAQDESLQEWIDGMRYVAPRIVEVARAFDGEMAPLQKQLATAGDIEQALKVKAARDHIAALPEVADAVSTVEMCAQAAAAQKYKAEDEKSKIPPPAAIPGTNAPAASRVVVVYRQPDSAPVAFRKAPLSRTRNSPNNQDIVAALEAGADGDVRRQGSVTRKTGKAFFRVALHTSSPALIRDVNVMVQAFGRDLSSTKKMVPVQAAQYVTPLAQLEDGAVYLVYPPVTFNGERMPSRESGQKFYGVALTVFDSRGAVLYQGVTRRGLEPFAAATLP